MNKTNKQTNKPTNKSAVQAVTDGQNVMLCAGKAVEVLWLKRRIFNKSVFYTNLVADSMNGLAADVHG